MTEQLNNNAELVAVEAETKVNVFTKAKNFIVTHKKETAIVGVTATLGLAAIARLAWKKDSDLTELAETIVESQGKDLTEPVTDIVTDVTSDEEIISEIEEALEAMEDDSEEA